MMLHIAETSTRSRFPTAGVEYGVVGHQGIVANHHDADQRVLAQVIVAGLEPGSVLKKDSNLKPSTLQFRTATPLFRSAATTPLKSLRAIHDPWRDPVAFAIQRHVVCIDENHEALGDRRGQVSRQAPGARGVDDHRQRGDGSGALSTGFGSVLAVAARENSPTVGSKAKTVPGQDMKCSGLGFQPLITPVPDECGHVAAMPGRRTIGRPAKVPRSARSAT
ncbi:MAG: hypothetical protein U1F20_08920 [Lysobacterales bacterium]